VKSEIKIGRGTARSGSGKADAKVQKAEGKVLISWTEGLQRRASEEKKKAELGEGRDDMAVLINYQNCNR